MADFRQLKVWARGRSLTQALYRSTARFPSDERRGLVSQIRRAVVSITANIAEGSGRRTPRTQAQFYSIALASARELESLLIVASDLSMLAPDTFAEHMQDLDQIERMLAGILRAVER